MIPTHICEKLGLLVLGHVLSVRVFVCVPPPQGMSGSWAVDLYALCRYG